jgi:hypothetical protein
MTNAQTIRALIAFSIIPGTFLLLILFAIDRFNMTQPQPQQQPQPAREQAVSIALMWRTPMADGASPRQVLQSTAKRMEYEQSTLLGSDRNAQALIKVLEAIAILEGRETKTEDGFPIIE